MTIGPRAASLALFLFVILAASLRGDDPAPSIHAMAAEATELAGGGLAAQSRRGLCLLKPLEGERRARRQNQSARNEPRSATEHALGGGWSAVGREHKISYAESVLSQN